MNENSMLGCQYTHYPPQFTVANDLTEFNLLATHKPYVTKYKVTVYKQVKSRRPIRTDMSRTQRQSS